MRGLQSHYLASDWFADDYVSSKRMDSVITSRVADLDSMPAGINIFGILGIHKS